MARSPQGIVIALTGPSPKSIARVFQAVGTGVTEFKVGDRVAYCNGPIGAYSEVKAHPAERLVKVPEGISFEQAAKRFTLAS